MTDKTKTAKAGKKPPTDWEAIEREFRAGQLSVREIARQHGVSHVAIAKRAKVEAWARDLSKRVREEVTNRLVTSEVTNGNAQEAVEVAAARGVELVRQHRSSLGRAQRVVEKLLDELDTTTENIEDIEDSIEEETAGDKNPKRRAMMLRAISLPQRAQTAAALSVTLKNLIPLERQAFNLDDGEDRNKRHVISGELPTESEWEAEHVTDH